LRFSHGHGHNNTYASLGSASRALLRPSRAAESERIPYVADSADYSPAGTGYLPHPGNHLAIRPLMGAGFSRPLAVWLAASLTMPTTGCRTQTSDASHSASARAIGGNLTGDPTILQQDDGQWVMPAKNYAA